ncbi:DNA helicase MCM9-like [Leguminivora glycinivorella]|uniref:DNA helicase MCM9-like n=1 Tax=Leguminivora glycinivorella TaxID=1035111 RepID=UPI00200C89CA|nr:DNA helicase MCM9-like [Leguminivora glycinivorella]
MILEYVLKYHLQDCIDILTEEDILAFYSIKIDFLKLFEIYPDIGDKVLCSPVDNLPQCHEDIIKAQQYILEQSEYKSTIEKLPHCSLKKNVHARIFGLPVCPELHRTIFPKNVDLGCFLKVTGTIVRVTQAKMLEYQRKYVCVKCKFENCVQAEFEHRYVLKAPSRCGNDEARCKSSTFTQVNLVSREHCKDYQEIKIQEQVNKLGIGTIPGSMWVVLEDDLVDSCKPGDDVHICGTVRRRWRPAVQAKQSEVELVLQANYLEVCNAQKSEVLAAAPDVKECFDEFWAKYEACPLKGRDQILKSVCPQVYGLYSVKLALLLTVLTGAGAAGAEAETKSGAGDDSITRVRGQCHLLLVGDPGTGKSQLLRAGATLAARAVLTSGAGSTRAGLTCSALREGGEWQLEAGALVLADGGVCCVDELAQLRPHDRAAVHEAMEQQTVSVAKAGIVCKLNTRCAVVAACNPRGRYEPTEPLQHNVALGTPLLSRFDLIFILLDTKNKAWDKLVSSYILFGGAQAMDSKKQWSIEKLQMYIGLVGGVHTEMTAAANTILRAYYMSQRRAATRDPSRTTVRMLDSLVRLSQAHCRLMRRTRILPADAVTAVALVDLSMQDCALADTTDALHDSFHKHPDFHYLATARTLLTKLNLHEIWQNELLTYAKLLQVDRQTLERDIENKSTKLFEKFNDVSDDNIPLSSTLVTSSYFKKKNEDQIEFVNDTDDRPVFDRRDNVNEKFAATLKKHAALNKLERKPPPVQKSRKRKRKENVNNQKLGKKKSDKSGKKQFFDSISDSDSEEQNTTINLNGVPSVNDIFNEIGIDFNFDDSGKSNALIENSDTATDDKEDSNKSYVYDKDTEAIVTKEDKSSKSLIENKNREKDHTSTVKPNTSSNTISKLKQFQCVEKHDISKYEEKVNTITVHKENEVVVKLENASDSLHNTSYASKKSVTSSQMSIFESSDCDIDLDI